MIKKHKFIIMFYGNYITNKKKGVVMIISVLNQKGGVGKTTTAVSLASRFAKMEYRTLLVDLDPQANATVSTGNAPVETVFQKIAISENLTLMPASKNLSFIEKDLNPDSVKNMLKNEDFDFVLIDCPPVLNNLSLNAVNAADVLVVPVLSGDFFSLVGLRDIFLTIQTSANPNLDYKILITNINERLAITPHFIKKLTESVGKEKLFSTGIRIDSKIKEAPFSGTVIDLYDANSKGSLDYGDLAVEIIEIKKEGNFFNGNNDLK